VCVVAFGAGLEGWEALLFILPAAPITILDIDAPMGGVLGVPGE